MSVRVLEEWNFWTINMAEVRRVLWEMQSRSINHGDDTCENVLAVWDLEKHLASVLGCEVAAIQKKLVKLGI